jgi:hypothetical protein
MTVIRLELDVPDGKQAADMANILIREYVHPERERQLGWASARVAVLSDWEVQRERTLLAAAQYFYPPPPGGRGVSHGDGH